MIRTRHLLLTILLLAFALVRPMLAQTAVPSSPIATPEDATIVPANTNLKDPGTLMALAEKANGLGDPGLKPWHLKVSYDIFDGQDKLTGSGIFEEWWMAKDKWKRTYAGSHYTDTEYHLPGGSAHEGSGLAVPWPEMLIAGKLLKPVTDTLVPSTVSDATHTGQIQLPGPLELNPLPFSKPPLVCVKHSMNRSNGPGDSLGDCFEPGKTALRLSAFSGVIATYNKIGTFQGRFIPLESEISANRHRIVAIHVISLVGMTPSEESVFTPSVPLVPRTKDELLHVQGSVLAGRKISGRNPAYPSSSKMNGEQGLVILGAVINEQGHIENLEVQEAPSKPLGEAAASAVRTWTYEPYLLNGSPTKIDTTINVIYRLGN